MGRSSETYSKKEKEKKKLQKRKEKAMRKEERRDNSQGGELDSMMAYVDENGVISDTPPDPTVKKKAIIAANIEIGIPKREEQEDHDGYRGKVTHYNDSKGYGFIKDLMSQENYFFHVNGLLEEVTEGDSVRYELERGQRGMNAVQVKKVDLEAEKAAAEAAASAEEGEEGAEGEVAESTDTEAATDTVEATDATEASDAPEVDEATDVDEAPEAEETTEAATDTEETEDKAKDSAEDSEK